MPKYQIEDTETGRTMVVEGDAPPSESDVQELFANVSESSAAGPELRELSPAKKPRMHSTPYSTERQSRYCRSPGLLLPLFWQRQV